jgi:hypothetical protein
MHQGMDECRAMICRSAGNVFDKLPTRNIVG